MKSAVPNPHPEHMFNILWAQAEHSAETQLRIREGEIESSEVEIWVSIRKRQK